MYRSPTRWRQLWDDDDGAVTVDWVALSALALLLGTSTIYALFNGGIASLVGEVNQVETNAVDFASQPVPDLNRG